MSLVSAAALNGFLCVFHFDRKELSCSQIKKNTKYILLESTDLSFRNSHAVDVADQIILEIWFDQSD